MWNYYAIYNYRENIFNYILFFTPTYMVCIICTWYGNTSNTLVLNTLRSTLHTAHTIYLSDSVTVLHFFSSYTNHFVSVHYLKCLKKDTRYCPHPRLCLFSTSFCFSSRPVVFHQKNIRLKNKWRWQTLFFPLRNIFFASSRTVYCVMLENLSRIFLSFLVHFCLDYSASIPIHMVG